MRLSILKILIVFLFLSSCHKENEDRIFIDKLNKLENEITDEKRKSFFINDERRILSLIKNDSDFSFKSNILDKTNDSLLIKYFNSKGVTNQNDIINIITTSLHRKINNRSINLQSQINQRLRVLNIVNGCKKIEEEKLKKSNSFKVGDTIQLRLRIEKANGIAYQTECELDYPDWKFDDKKDLLIKGVILRKYSYDEIPDNRYMEILITDLNKNFVIVGRKLPKIGDLFELTINYAVIDH